jgi:eukaryotic-like serine/threonine-protein kinase
VPLATGTRLGLYEIVASLGAGGMGEVYRGRDTRLGRDVALKILPDLVARDKERLARFDREAKLLASLAHPNIATLYALEEIDGRPVLVMELAPGDDLSRRLDRGPLPLDEARADGPRTSARTSGRSASSRRSRSTVAIRCRCARETSICT